MLCPEERVMMVRLASTGLGILVLSLGCPGEQVVVRETEASCGNGEPEPARLVMMNLEQTDGC